MKNLENLLTPDALNIIKGMSPEDLNKLTLSELAVKKEEANVNLPDNWALEDSTLTISLKNAPKANWYKSFFQLQDHLTQGNVVELRYDVEQESLTISIEDIKEEQIKTLCQLKKENLIKLAETTETSLIEFDKGIKCLSEDNYKVRIPIAKVGKWKHAIYGTLEYTKDTLKKLQDNIKEKIVGFEAPLFIGHPQDKDGGAPAEGYLLATELEDNILYGIWGTNKNIYREIQDGKYRYSSSEFITKFRDKVSGDDKGLVLVGMALTNRPFIPNLPKVVALGQKDTYNNELTMLTFDYTRYNDGNIKLNSKTEENNMVTEKEIGSVATESVVNEQKESDLLAEYKQSFMNELNTKVSLIEETYKQQLSEVIEQNKLLQQRVERFEQQEAAQALEKKIDYVNNLSLPQDTKQEYVQLLKENKLGLAEEVVLQSLKKLSDRMSMNVFSQYGESYDTENFNNLNYEDPYKDVIEKNKKIADSLRSLNSFK